MLCSCGTKRSQEHAALRVGITNWPGYDVVVYAQKSGLFTKRGIDVDLIRFTVPQDAVRALLRGQVDACFMNLSVAIQADPGNDSPVFILVADTSYGSDGIVARSGITSLAELRGKRIGAKLGAANHLILLEALRAHNIAPTEVDIADVPNEISAQMFRDGELDAVAIWEPLLSELARDSGGTILHTTRDVDTLVIDGLATRATRIASKMDALRRFILGWLDLMAIVDKHPDQVFAIAAAELGQNAESFANDYAGLKKGDAAMNQRMLQGGRLSEAVQLLKNVLNSDPRHSRVLRQDVSVNAEPFTAAVSTWRTP